MVASSDRSAVSFSLSPGSAHDAPEGRKLLNMMGCVDGVVMVMDRAYEGDDTRAVAIEKGFVHLLCRPRRIVVTHGNTTRSYTSEEMR